MIYELAILQALPKQLVQIIRNGEAIPFDVAETRTIYVDHKDLDSVEAAKNEIIEQSKALERDSTDIETPISVSRDLQLLRQSEKPEERSLADLVAAVVDLRASLSKVKLRVGTKDQEGLLGEIQTELRALPARLDDYLGDLCLPGMRRGRFHPMMFRELLHMGPRTSPALGVLILASMSQESMPWLYEKGVEVYRVAKQGSSSELKETAHEFRQAVEFSIHGPVPSSLVGARRCHDHGGDRAASRSHARNAR